ncbi:MAG TPA: carboxypeptidase-like regulatory domain-containing protein [Nitrospiria bacterium]|nr:carboxypeptidase-like regulatory domain-containing protein [Nitrospiria bacterium]
MKKYFYLSLGLLVLTAQLSGVALGYDEVKVTNGGSITGKVILKGPVPPPRIFPLVLYPFGPFCKRISDGQGNVRLMEFAVDSGGGLKDAVVAVEAVKQGKTFPPVKNDFVTVDCMFHPADVSDAEMYSVGSEGKLHHTHPLVTVVRNHEPTTIINKDPVVHNAQYFQSEKGNIVLNFPLPVSDKPRGGILNLAPGKRITELICGMHEFMQSWGFVVDNPYYAKTKKGGEFTIDNLPPGTYKVSAWHPHLEIMEKEVTVPANGNVRLDFEFNGADVQRPIYESQREFRVHSATPHSQMLEKGEERIIMEGEDKDESK